MVASTKYSSEKAQHLRSLLCKDLIYDTICEYVIQSEYSVFSYYLANNYTAKEICYKLNYC